MVVGPVGRLQGGVEGTEPDDQRDEGDGVQDQPSRGHRYHRLLVLLPASKSGSHQDGDVEEAEHNGKAHPFLLSAVVEREVGDNEGDKDAETNVESQVFFGKEGRDDRDAPNFEDETCQEGGRLEPSV